MSRIDTTFRRLKKRSQAAFIPFLVAGDPDLETTQELLLKMAEAGADMIEIGIPSQNPVMDGGVIRKAHQRALQRGIDLDEIFRMIERVSERVPPLILMSYFDVAWDFGLADLARACRSSGVEGVILPDIHPGKKATWLKEARRVGLDAIFLINPATSLNQVIWVLKHGRGFIYYASVPGATGPQKKLPRCLERVVQNLRALSRRPVAVGFGISTPEQVSRVSRFADAVIVGSAIVKVIEENLTKLDLALRVMRIVKSFCLASKL